MLNQYLIYIQLIRPMQKGAKSHFLILKAIVSGIETSITGLLTSLRETC